MTDFKPGDIVDVVRRIEGAKVTAVEFDGIDVMWPGQKVSELIPTADPTYTITRRLPSPQAGDVWRLRSGHIWVAKDSQYNEDLVAFHAHNAVVCAPVGQLDFTGAELLFRLPAGRLAAGADGIVIRAEDVQ